MIKIFKSHKILFYKKLLLTLSIINFSFFASAQNISKMKDIMSKYYYASPTDSVLLKSKQKGIIPVPEIVTEPALGGFGGGLGLGFMHSSNRSLRKGTPPTITGVFGGMTTNDSWALGLGHTQTFLDDHIRYTGVILKANVNMEFYEEIFANTFSFKVNMDAWATSHKLLFRVGETNLFFGTKYLFAKTVNKLDLETNHPKLDSLISTLQNTSKLGMLGVLLTYDSRDNPFSPDHGIDLGLTFDSNTEFLGGDKNFSKLDIFAKYYFQVSKTIYGGVRADAKLIDKNAPFYVKPFIGLRGVPAMRYQGNNVFVAETQWRWAFYKNWSVLGFVGSGKAVKDTQDFGSAELIYNYGFGGRYTLKKLFGIRVGGDVAWSNEDFAWYISIGSSF